MAVDDNSYDIRDLPDLMVDDFDKNLNTTFPNFSDYTESQLCIPQDPIEDLEWYPNFNNDIISLNGIVLTPEQETLDFGFNFKPSNQSENIFSTNFPLTPEPLNEPENIFSTNFPLTPEQHTENTEENKRVPLKDCSCYDNKKRGIEDSTSFANKKQRSKRVSKGAWSIKDVFLAFENEGPSERMQRRCTHCLTDQTPQWRVGPMGPKTLCNACGVRYKSGRLVPEYRPAASPTFDCHKHSNFHKKILKKKGLSLSD